MNTPSKEVSAAAKDKSTNQPVSAPSESTNQQPAPEANAQMKVANSIANAAQARLAQMKEKALANPATPVKKSSDADAGDQKMNADSAVSSPDASSSATKENSLTKRQRKQLKKQQAAAAKEEASSLLDVGKLELAFMKTIREVWNQTNDSVYFAGDSKERNEDAIEGMLRSELPRILADWAKFKSCWDKLPGPEKPRYKIDEQIEKLVNLIPAKLDKNAKLYRLARNLYQLHLIEKHAELVANDKKEGKDMNEVVRIKADLEENIDAFLSQTRDSRFSRTSHEQRFRGVPPANEIGSMSDEEFESALAEVFEVVYESIQAGTESKEIQLEIAGAGKNVAAKPEVKDRKDNEENKHGLEVVVAENYDHRTSGKLEQLAKNIIAFKNNQENAKSNNVTRSKIFLDYKSLSEQDLKNKGTAGKRLQKEKGMLNQKDYLKNLVTLEELKRSLESNTTDDAAAKIHRAEFLKEFKYYKQAIENIKLHLTNAEKAYPKFPLKSIENLDKANILFNTVLPLIYKACMDANDKFNSVVQTAKKKKQQDLKDSEEQKKQHEKLQQDALKEIQARMDSVSSQYTEAKQIYDNVTSKATPSSADAGDAKDLKDKQDKKEPSEKIKAEMKIIEDSFAALSELKEGAGGKEAKEGIDSKLNRAKELVLDKAPNVPGNPAQPGNPAEARKLAETTDTDIAAMKPLVQAIKEAQTRLVKLEKQEALERAAAEKKLVADKKRVEALIAKERVRAHNLFEQLREIKRYADSIVNMKNSVNERDKAAANAPSVRNKIDDINTLYTGLEHQNGPVNLIKGKLDAATTCLTNQDDPKTAEENLKRATTALDDLNSSKPTWDAARAALVAALQQELQKILDLETKRQADEAAKQQAAADLAKAKSATDNKDKNQNAGAGDQKQAADKNKDDEKLKKKAKADADKAKKSAGASTSVTGMGPGRHVTTSLAATSRQELALLALLEGDKPNSSANASPGNKN